MLRLMVMEATKKMGLYSVQHLTEQYMEMERPVVYADTPVMEIILRNVIHQKNH